MEEEKEIKRLLEDVKGDIETAKKYKKVLERTANLAERMGADISEEKRKLLEISRALEDIESAIKEEEKRLKK